MANGQPFGPFDPTDPHERQWPNGLCIFMWVGFPQGITDFTCDRYARYICEYGGTVYKYHSNKPIILDLDTYLQVKQL